MVRVVGGGEVGLKGGAGMARGTGVVTKAETGEGTEEAIAMATAIAEDVDGEGSARGVEDVGVEDTEETTVGIRTGATAVTDGDRAEEVVEAEVEGTDGTTGYALSRHPSLPRID